MKGVCQYESILELLDDDSVEDVEVYTEGDSKVYEFSSEELYLDDISVIATYLDARTAGKYEERDRYFLSYDL